MNDFDEQIGALWHSQSVTPVDIAIIKKRLRSARIKHRLYLLLDCLCLIPLIYLFYWSRDVIHGPERYFLLGIGVMAIGYTAYLTWLRRLSLVSGKATQDHLRVFLRQLENNIRIARVTRHSAWVAQGLLVGFYCWLYVSGKLPEAKFVPVIIALAAAGLANAIFYVWATRRQQRFIQELHQLEKQLGDIAPR
ncbi:hypothetical protein [Salinimonas chungwhensis]|uniref:hypothetical protein n=1 Tax=Salinimonas chungwhensis TaxID=265425 RepID=UPI00037EEA15|nr:hypothetical protein [Salinimonas chungwhensis]